MFNSSTYIDGTLRDMYRDEEAHVDDQPLQCDLKELEDFLGSRVWADMRKWLQGRISIHQQLVESSPDIHTIKRSVGIIQNCRDILNLPDWFIAELQAELMEDEADG